MVREIKNIEQYCFYPILESNAEIYDTPIILFNKSWKIVNDYWMKHIHIKITDKCDAHCPFCIERESHIKENKQHLLDNLQVLLREMANQNHLATVSITGGEPSLCEYTGEVIDCVKQYNTFLNVNTNFHNIIHSHYDPDWINISRHSLERSDNYTGLRDIDKEALKEYRISHPLTKVRIQCVLHPFGLHTIDEIRYFIEYYSDIADDFSFRRLINTTNEAPKDDLFQQLKHFLYSNADFVEQVTKDYYVYETWKYKGMNITLSHSDMRLLCSLEKIEEDSILREIIIHPDGLVSGSWYRDKRKIISL